MTYSIIAERELVVSFSLIGVRGFIATSRDEALLYFNMLTGKKTSIQELPIGLEHLKILIVSEQVSEYILKEITEWQLKGEYPLIVEIPCLQGAMYGKKTLTDAIREAVGIHV